MAANFRRLGVFCGPSLPPEDRRVLAGVSYLQPASRGDIARASAQYEALLVIDGVFHHDLAPSPKEVYAACKRVRMFGASSMGALRAAECAPFGMLALGIVARWYTSERIDGDDEVALLVHPETQAALTVPLVNVRYVMRLAQRRGVLTTGNAEAAVKDARAIFYMDRTWDAVLTRIPESARAAVREIALREGDLKRWDARFALRAAMRHLRLSAS